MDAEIKRLDMLTKTLFSGIGDLDPLFQNVAANHLCLAGAGLVEKSVAIVVGEYAGQRGNSQLRRFSLINKLSARTLLIAPKSKVFWACSTQIGGEKSVLV
ncbi:hypothetical protein [Palleronia salina]|uniref:hypothetical protein n=1 Tax=Palleronia salina TaxID=313368 RepID=UPI001114F4B8|nr:hypothetical protein [Palleronia salina]